MAKNNHTATENMQENKFKAIQDILMGGELRQIHDRMDEMEEKLSSQAAELGKQFSELKTELLDLIEKRESSLLEKFEQMEARLEEKISQNHQTTQDEIARIDHEDTRQQELGKILVKIGESLITKKEG